VGLFALLRDDIDALVHPTAQQDALMCARHRAFIASRLLAGLVVVAAFALYGAVWGDLSAWEALPFAWLIVPIIIAFVLSRVGRYEDAHMLSSLALAGLVLVVAARSGGIASFATVWLVAVPLEATVSLSRRVVLVAAAMAASVAGLLWFNGASDLFVSVALLPQE